MTLDEAIQTAKNAAARTGRQTFVVLDLQPDVAPVDSYHAGDFAALTAVWPDAPRICTVHPDGRVIVVAQVLLREKAAA